MASTGLLSIAAFSQHSMGKDTLCDYVSSKLNKGKKKEWKRTAFADEVKNTFCKNFGYTRAFIEEWKRKDEIPEGLKVTVRQALQKIGDGFREINPDIWIDIALRSEEKIIISDGRYINEAKKVKERNGFNILIYRSNFLNSDPNRSEAELRPLLEHCNNIIPDGKIYHGTLVRYPEGLDHFDVFIRNSGDIKEFYAKIDKYVLPLIVDKLN
jgi:hypothetical protein